MVIALLPSFIKHIEFFGLMMVVFSRAAIIMTWHFRCVWFNLRIDNGILIKELFGIRTEINLNKTLSTQQVFNGTVVAVIQEKQRIEIIPAAIPSNALTAFPKSIQKIWATK
jgi:hypothetical protein